MATAYARGILARRDGVGKGRFPSGGFIAGPEAASWGPSALFSLLSSVLSSLSALFPLLSLPLVIYGQRFRCLRVRR